MTAVRTALVIGGGIAGPVTALALRRAGIEARVFEAYENTADGVGGILMVAPNGLAALGIVGAEDAVRSIGQPVQRMVMADGTGKRFGEFAGLAGLPPSQTMWRSELYEVLQDRATAEGIQIDYGKRLVAVDDSTTGVTARFADGTTATADVLIGADGIHSAVRTMIDPDAPAPEAVGLLGFGFDGGVADSVVPGDFDSMHFVFGSRAFFGYWTRPDGHTVCFCNLPHPEPTTAAQARAVPAAEWLRQLREVYADDVPARELLANAAPDGLYVFGSMEILPSVPRWHRGRMVLVGDSAHAPSSSSGQGVSLAVESAIQLARCLRDLPDAPTAFAAYEQLRRARVEKVAAYAAKQNNRKASGRVGKALLSLLMPIAMRTVLKPEKMFGWMHGYRIDWDDAVAPSAGRAADAVRIAG